MAKEVTMYAPALIKDLRKLRKMFQDADYMAYLSEDSLDRVLNEFMRMQADYYYCVKSDLSFRQRYEHVEKSNLSVKELYQELLGCFNALNGAMEVIPHAIKPQEKLAQFLYQFIKRAISSQDSGFVEKCFNGKFQEEVINYKDEHKDRWLFGKRKKARLSSSGQPHIILDARNLSQELKNNLLIEALACDNKNVFDIIVAHVAAVEGKASPRYDNFLAALGTCCRYDNLVQWKKADALLKFDFSEMDINHFPALFRDLLNHRVPRNEEAIAYLKEVLTQKIDSLPEDLRLETLHKVVRAIVGTETKEAFIKNVMDQFDIAKVMFAELVNKEAHYTLEKPEVFSAFLGEVLQQPEKIIHVYSKNMIKPDNLPQVQKLFSDFFQQISPQKSEELADIALMLKAIKDVEPKIEVKICMEYFLNMHDKYHSCRAPQIMSAPVPKPC